MSIKNNLSLGIISMFFWIFWFYFDFRESFTKTFTILVSINKVYIQFHAKVVVNIIYKKVYIQFIFP